MFYYLNGKATLVEPDRAVIDCSGVGYLLSVTKKTYDELVKAGCVDASGNAVGSNVKLFTYYHVREDAAELFGFYSERECSLFKLLISVSGVGPKAALAILSALTADDFIKAVVAQDAKAISSAQGIGLKSAQKIILELKDKLSGWSFEDGGEVAVPDEPVADSDVQKEAVNALMVLGYTRQEAAKAVKNAKGATLEDIIKYALSQLI